jgi:3-oxoacyl-[acyl-carrier-protein] synthase II
MGEGCGALVLEREESALARGVEPLVRFSGWALGADGQGYLDIEPKGKSIEEVIRRALQKAGIGASEIGYINAHGTGTRINDYVESQAIQRLFGKFPTRVSSTKGATGHLLGAAGSVEAVFSALTLVKGELPATRNLEHPDPQCAVRHVEKGGMKMGVHHVLSLSYGIGGQLGAVVFSKV